MLLSIAGASSSGKTTLLKELAKLLGKDNVAHVDMDGYHVHTRKERLEINEYPDELEANDFPKLINDLETLLSGHPISMPTYNHTQGEFGAPFIIHPTEYIFIEGLHANLINQIAGKKIIDFSMFIYPEEDLRKAWKVYRDVNQRGYSYESALEQISKREEYVRKVILPQIELSDCIFFIEKYRRNKISNKLLITNEKKEILTNINPLDDKLPIKFVERNFRGHPFYEISFIGEGDIGQFLQDFLNKYQLDFGKISKSGVFDKAYQKNVNTLALIISVLRLIKRRGPSL
jgi:phosphoribulokinase